MSRIIYEEQEQLEEIFTGTFILDGINMTPEQQRQKIIDMMEIAGVKVNDIDNIVITYEGATDEDGISDTQTTKFVVKEKVMKEVPFKVEEEYVYGGEFTEEEAALSKEEQDQIVYNNMIKEGIFEDDATYEVVNNGADDHNGEYDTPVESYSVYKVISKEPLEEITENKEEVSENNEEIVNNPEIDKSEEELKKLKELRNKLNSITDISKRNILIDEILGNIDKIEEKAINNEKVEVYDEFKQELAEIEEVITKVEKEIKETVKEYDQIYRKLQDIIDEENKEFSKDQLLSSEELNKLREEFSERKLQENEKSIEIKKEIDLQKKLLTSLNRRKNKLKREIEKAEALGLTYSEYKDISSTLQKTTIMNKVLEKKGLEDIIIKKANDRTKEEKDMLKEAKEEIFNEIAGVRKEDKTSSIMDVIEALYLLDDTYKLEEEPKDLSVNEEEVNTIKENGELLPAKVVGDYPKEYTYEPGKAPSELADLVDNYEYKLVNESEFDSTTMNKEEEFERIMGFAYDPSKYDIRIDEGVNSIDDGVSEVLQIFEKVPKEELEEDPIVDNEELEGSLPDIVEETEDTTDEDYEYTDDEVLERITLFRDLDNDGDIYIRKPLLNRFEIEPLGDPVRIDGALCYRIDEEDVDYILDNADNDFSPYMVDVIDVNIDEPVNEEEVEDTTDEEYEYTDDEVVERITLFRDLDNDGDIYVRKPLLNRFEINPIGEPVRINNAVCYKIDEEDVDYILDNADNDFSPYVVEFIDVNLGKKEVEDKDTEKEQEKIEKKEEVPEKKKTEETQSRPHVEAILQKLTKGLSINSKDATRYKASNIKVSKTFKDELHSGNWLYNVAHFGVAVIKVPFNFIRKIASKLLLTARGKESMEELKNRLDNLTEEELDVLFNEYKGTRLKTDMNNQINPVILDKLREYGLSQVEKINNSIKENYSVLFSILGEIKALEEKLGTTEDKDQLKAYYEERKKLMSKAANAIRLIENNRVVADNLLSSGVHGIEEDFKAVSTKLSYVGMRFAKNNDFDNELQEKLGNYGQGLNDALDNGDDEAIVSNFMGLETCYYDNTEIKGSLVGQRSVGTKYYSPIAEQFDYRDDPFVRDLLTTVALTSAAISAINAVRVHQIEDGKLLQNQQNEANRVNQVNDDAIDQAHQVGDNITAQASKFQKGMKAQTKEDSLNVANMSERGNLDHHNWGFGSDYRTEDSLNHEMYNSVYDDATSKITDISSRYSSGTISQVEALKEMANVANNTQNALHDVVDKYLQICKDYAKSHPQFDLHSVQSAMKYIEKNPNAIAEMNEGMVTAVEEAEKLASLSAEHIEALASLPSDMTTTLIGAAGAAALALKVVKDMDNKYGKKGTYGNEVVDMMEEYMNDEYEDEIEDQDVIKK